jgi:drug/metabolite transporter superfamily protein YnfA
LFYLLLLAALVCTLLLWRQPRGAGRALAAGLGVLFLAAALILLLRKGFLPGHGPRRWTLMG